jgi:hypothetical protein
MDASHPHLFQSSITNESEIRKLVTNHFLLDRAVLQCRPTTGEDLPTPHTNEIVVFSSFLNVDSASQPTIYSANSLITIKSN